MLGLRSVAQNSLRAPAVRCAQTTARSQITKALRARCKVLRFSPAPTGPDSARCASPQGRSLERTPLKPEAQRAGVRCWGPRERRRGAQGLDAARSASSSDFARLSERSALQGRVASSARRVQARAPQSSPRSGPPTPGSPFLGDFFWRSKRSYSPAGARPGFPQPHPKRQENNQQKTSATSPTR